VAQGNTCVKGATMSEPNVVVANEQSQVSTPIPEQQQPTPEAAVQQQAAEAAEEAARQEEAARKEADSTFKATVKAFRQGEKSYRAGLLEAGRLADLYVHQRMALGDKRAPAIQALEGELAKHSSSTVKVDELIRSYHAFRLLAEEPGIKADLVPYGHYRDCWSQLIERHGKDSKDETWNLLPGLETECKALFATATADNLSRDAVKDAVKTLLRTYADRQAEEARKAKEAAEAEARAKAEEKAKAQEEAMNAAKAHADAKEAAETAKEEEKAALTEAMRKTEEAMRQKAQEAIAAQAAADRAARDKARAEAAAREAEKAKAKAEAKARKAEERKAQRSQEPARNVLPEKADPSGLAGMIAEAITDNDTPDDVFALVLRRLKDSKELSRQSVRAIDAALVVLARKPEATVKPSVNGQLVGAA
jgi:hypothetical protein